MSNFILKPSWQKLISVTGIFVAWLFLGIVPAHSSDLNVEIAPRLHNTALSFEKLALTNSFGQIFSITRLDFFISDFALRRRDGSWLEKTNWQEFLSLGRERSSFSIKEIPSENFDRIRFHGGLKPELNHTNPAIFPATHPLNPNLNGMHWGWTGGYIFLAAEGRWLDESNRLNGFSFHLANDPMLMTVEIPVALDLTTDQSLQLALNLDEFFDFKLSAENSSTHSRAGDEFAQTLRRKIEKSFSILSERRAPQVSNISRLQKSQELAERVSPTATPHPITFSAQFPMPDLPRDNPLTVEGVELGRRLFNEKLLSGNGEQSCASCHRAEKAFSDTQPFSAGAEGKLGTRNAMPLFNLAWKKNFFWDGRAATLREQVLIPIENPVEMNGSLPKVVARLRGGDSVEQKLALIPTLSPEEREQHFPPQKKLEDAFTKHALFASNAESHSPSPGGEGRGEGGRSIKSSVSSSDGAHGVAPPIEYHSLFNAAFGSPEINAERIARALEQFLITQVSFDSKFDRALGGKETLTDEEKRGFALFSTEYDPRREQFGADCFHCHGGALFQSQTFANNGLDSVFKDFGRYDATKNEGDKGKFAVPSLRNVAVTAPYMHDGRFKTLEEVMEHYSDDVKSSATLDPNLAKHPTKGLHLSAEDKKALVAFLQTLTDAKFVQKVSTGALTSSENLFH